MPQRTATTRLLKIASVLDRVPVSKTEWYRRIRKGTAPAPVRLSVNSVAWRESDIDAFIDALDAVAGGAAALVVVDAPVGAAPAAVAIRSDGRRPGAAK